MQLNAVLFDLDGTLLDSAPDIRQGLNLMLEEDGRPAISLEQVKSMVGDGAMELCRRALLATGGVMADDICPYVQKFIGHYRSVRPDPAQIFPGVIETLESLKKKNVKMGVCTNKAESATNKILDELKLLPYFGFVAGGDTYQVHKPNPGHVLGVLDALQATPANSLFIGDGPNDVIASRRAGVSCIVITHGYAQDYDSMGADRLISSFADLPEAICAEGFDW